ncbi:hypothetical protein MTP09_09045 [Chryseobacterium suipulveris]|uniref:Cell wall anchor protein n=1 Tax=Chryseobacterium suipulveris TaxID=2929800 RepID=A0ABY4BQI0_9FLAO|nr:hypothetical protein [Chryseobacterium suipulveris]UOE40066.1 hypothetical protein MTP09_09045 [Chryseobacterium suipulveris]
MKKITILLGILLGLSIQAQSWNLTGNSGTNSLTNYIGTSDNSDLIFRTNSTEGFRLTNDGKFHLASLISRSAYPMDLNFRFISPGSSAFYVVANQPDYFLIKDLRTNFNYFRISTASNINANSTIFLQENSGKVVIGTTTIPNCSTCSDYNLFVKKGIKTEKVKVEFANANGWADYVFENDYKLMPLEELKTFIKKNKHLPEVPTATEVVENGLELKEFNALLLKKVEELTLHLIQLNEKLQDQNDRIKELETRKGTEL